MAIKNAILAPTFSSTPRRAIDRGLAPAFMYEPLWLLLQAHDYAAELGQDIWAFAIDLSELRAARLTMSELRWLVCRGYVDHASELTAAGDLIRRFDHNRGVLFPSKTAVVLTASGVELARKVCGRESQNVSWQRRLPMRAKGGMEDALGAPKWDRDRRQLRFDRQVVKEFKLPSSNQESVLAVFEEEHWPPRIDDPLRPVPELDSRRRLHDTIRALNRNQKSKLIRFRGDGSGSGICWELTLVSPAKESDPSPEDSPFLYA